MRSGTRAKPMLHYICLLDYRLYGDIMFGSDIYPVNKHWNLNSFNAFAFITISVAWSSIRCEYPRSALFVHPDDL